MGNSTRKYKISQLPDQDLSPETFLHQVLERVDTEDMESVFMVVVYKDRSFVVGSSTMRLSDQCMAVKIMDQYTRKGIEESRDCDDE